MASLRLLDHLQSVAISDVRDHGCLSAGTRALCLAAYKLFFVDKACYGLWTDLLSGHPAVAAAIEDLVKRTAIVEKHPDDEWRAYYALQHARLVTGVCGREWYAERFDGAMNSILLDSGLLRGDLGREYYAKTYRGTRLFEALERFGLFTPECGREWYAKRFSGYELYDALRRAGFLNFGADAEVDEWYAEHLYPEYLHIALRRSGRLPEYDRDWYADNFESDALVTCLREFGLLTPDCGRDWYSKHLYERDLCRALSQAGLMTPECGREWYVERLYNRPHLLSIALKEAGFMK